MELFSEVYNCYYQVLRHLLCSQNALTMDDIRRQICREGFEESLLSILPKLESGAWNLFQRDGELYLSRLTPSFITPLTDLEKAYLKALLADPRMGLFLDPEQTKDLEAMLSGVSPLWRPEQFCFYDRFGDGDPYRDENYRRCFRALLQAQKNRQYAEINYTAPGGKRIRHFYLPARLEYSVKNDKFRLLALTPAGRHKPGLVTLNVARIQSVRPAEKRLSPPVDLNAVIQASYYKEPLRLRIVNRRNALERAMLHFANYEKNTRKIDEDTYECLIYYNQSMETELLIEVMSFGPMLTVLGNERFLNSLKARLQRQLRLEKTSPSFLSPLPEENNAEHKEEQDG